MANNRKRGEAKKCCGGGRCCRICLCLLILLVLILIALAVIAISPLPLINPCTAPPTPTKDALGRPLYDYSTLSPSPPTEETIQVFSDPEGGKKVMEKVASRIIETPFSFSVTTGDNVRYGIYYLWLAFFSAMEKVCQRPMHIARGNHDATEAQMVKYFYLDPSSGFEYTILAGGRVLIFLDTEVGIGGEGGQEEWVRWLVTQVDPTKIILFSHRPPLSSGAHGNQTDLWPLLDIALDNGIPLWISGHDHNYEHIHLDSIDLVVFGGGGGDLRGPSQVPPMGHFNQTHGFLTLNLISPPSGPASVEVIAKSEEGEMIETFSTV